MNPASNSSSKERGREVIRYDHSYLCGQAPPRPNTQAYLLNVAARAVARGASSPLSISRPAMLIALKLNRSGVSSIDIKLLVSSAPEAKKGVLRSKSPRRVLLPAPEVKYCTPCCGLVRS